ncbi:prepilin peptidase [Lamprobacter sp.]|uniref:prepilin peptidase n=1 Tax=Lamprobacter sp. TaxID=3100796 RepID=UPI003A4E5D6E
MISVFEQTPALLYLTTALFGLAVGSFLNVLILRLPRIMEQEWLEDCTALLASAKTAGPQEDTAAAATPRLGLARPGSHCPSCGTAIRALDNIPILSWLRLRGRCSACKAKISVRYPLVEALTAVLSVVVVWQLGPTTAALAALILTWGLVALAVIDLDTQLLPDSLSLPLLWLGLLLSLGGTFTDPSSAILGAAAGYLLLWLVYQGFRLTTGKEGMGRGDFKLLALFGAWLGWQAVPQIILLSSLPGAIVGGALIASGRQQAGQPIPYGPFLAIAGWISLLWGESITEAYLRWVGLA